MYSSCAAKHVSPLRYSRVCLWSNGLRRSTNVLFALVTTHFYQQQEERHPACIMDGVTPVKVLGVRWKSSPGQPGQTVPSVLSALTETVKLLTPRTRRLILISHTFLFVQPHEAEWWINKIFIVFILELNQYLYDMLTHPCCFSDAFGAIFAHSRQVMAGLSRKRAAAGCPGSDLATSPHPRKVN